MGRHFGQARASEARDRFFGEALRLPARGTSNFFEIPTSRSLRDRLSQLANRDSFVLSLSSDHNIRFTIYIGRRHLDALRLFAGKEGLAAFGAIALAGSVSVT